MTLADEAQRYLAVVEFFRAQGCEPHWEREPLPPPAMTNDNALHHTPRGA